MTLIKDIEDEKKREQNRGWHIFIVYTLLFPLALFSAPFIHAMPVYLVLPGPFFLFSESTSKDLDYERNDL